MGLGRIGLWEVILRCLRSLVLSLLPVILRYLHPLILCYRSSSSLSSSKFLLGEGFVELYGEKWVVHRRIASQAFNMERVKGWIPEIVVSVENLLNKWEERRGEKTEFEMDVHKELHELSADIISRTAFGSCFEEGKRIFELQEQQASLVLEALRSVYVPGLRFLPTKKNKMRWRLDRETWESIVALIERSGKSMQNLGLLLALLMSPYKNDDGIEYVS